MGCLHILNLIIHLNNDFHFYNYQNKRFVYVFGHLPPIALQRCWPDVGQHLYRRTLQVCRVNST